ncbi:MAG: hypothetical protein MJ105_09525 [Lachnospiraceae bacterium]|nr:hypothetical protein [Lachnospiraceae bacterium]
MRKRNKEKQHTVNIGLSSMIVILIGLFFMVMAALAVSHAQNDYQLSRRMAEHNTKYYAASNQAMEKIAAAEPGEISFAIPVEQGQVLQVVGNKATDGSFQTQVWKIINQDVMEIEETIPFFTPKE